MIEQLNALIEQIRDIRELTTLEDDGKSIVIPTYTLKDIEDKLEALKKTQAETSQEVEIGKLFVLSTGHVTQKTSELLTEMSEEKDEYKVNYTVASSLYGFYLTNPIVTGRTEWEKDFPVEMKAIFEKAAEFGCAYILLDSAGPFYEGLPTFDW